MGTVRQNEKNAAVKRLLESQVFQFIPQSVQPQAGRSIPINNYSLTVRKESLTCYLPYFGVAHSAPVNPAKGPLDFTATNFAYSSEAGNRGNTLISIKLDNASDAQEFNFIVSSSGYTTLNVRFNSRQSISFYGQIRNIPARR
ncbi:MAG TPA: DUF4251 domain-containing protein [Daejeonella sp.]|nr:DUF4251 domain-containing protein [Daejeonella sp.]